MLVSESGQHHLVTAKLRFKCTNNMAEYGACVLGIRMALDLKVQELLVISDSSLLIHPVRGEWTVKNPKISPYVQLIQRLCERFRKIEFKHTTRIQNDFVDALETKSSMMQHPEKNYIDPLDISLKERHAHCSHVQAELDGKPWYIDVKRYIEAGKYLEEASSTQKKTIRRMANNFFLNGEILYRRTPDLGLLRCINATKAIRLLEEVHAGVCGPHIENLKGRILLDDYGR